MSEPLAGVDDGEIRDLLAKLAGFRSDLPPGEQRLLDGLLLASAEGAAGDVQGYGLQPAAVRRAALGAVIAFGLVAGGVAGSGGIAAAAPLEQSFFNQGGPQPTTSSPAGRPATSSPAPPSAGPSDPFLDGVLGLGGSPPPAAPAPAAPGLTSAQVEDALRASQARLTQLRELRDQLIALSGIQVAILDQLDTDLPEALRYLNQQISELEADIQQGVTLLLLLQQQGR
jgi:hypothetical protein